MLGQWGHKTSGSGHPMTGTTWSQGHESEPMPDTDWMVRNQGQYSLEIQDRSKDNWHKN